jgi:hypothetical protein
MELSPSAAAGSINIRQARLCRKVGNSTEQTFIFEICDWKINNWLQKSQALRRGFKRYDLTFTLIPRRNNGGSLGDLVSARAFGHLVYQRFGLARQLVDASHRGAVLCADAGG